MKQSIGGRRQCATEAGSDGLGKDCPADEILCIASRYPDVGEELSQIAHDVIAPRHKHNLFLGTKLSILWSMYGNLDNRQGVVFEPNHVVAIKQCSLVNSPSPAGQDRLLAPRCWRKVENESSATNLTRFNKIAIQGALQMAVDKEAISLSRVYSYYPKCNLPLFYV